MNRLKAFLFYGFQWKRHYENYVDDVYSFKSKYSILSYIWIYLTVVIVKSLKFSLFLLRKTQTRRNFLCNNAYFWNLNIHLQVKIYTMLISSVEKSLSWLFVACLQNSNFTSKAEAKTVRLFWLRKELINRKYK